MGCDPHGEEQGLRPHEGRAWTTSWPPTRSRSEESTFDNGSDFLNWSLIAWCDDHAVATITRSRPYEHNANAQVEQRNHDWVRRHAFRYRYETATELDDLNLLWAQVMARKNHRLPCVKATGWTETRSGHKKRIYDQPATPYARLLASRALTGPKADKLATIHHDLNPAAIIRKINTIQNRLLDSARDRTTPTRAHA